MVQGRKDGASEMGTQGHPPGKPVSGAAASVPVKQITLAIR